ncbi:MAG: 30S ribosome-binding factor RbfA [Actinomycetota bacterium]|nr:30S ribosome-binding factor RbfA [Actinomycetota bacterium]
MARVNELVREVVADELERLGDDDRLALLTVTHVEVTADLRHATVLLSSLPKGADEALTEHRGRLQAALGRQVRLKRTPQLSFRADPAIETGQKIEELLRRLDERTGDHDAGQ